MAGLFDMTIAPTGPFGLSHLDEKTRFSSRCQTTT
jgi:hypothetical protein